MPGTAVAHIALTYGQAFTGSVADLEIHQRTLGASEVAALAAVPPTSDYRLDETSGTTAHDANGLHDATLTGTASWVTPGHHSGDPAALSVDGSTGAASTSGPVLHTDQSFTVTAWVRLNAAGSTVQIAVSQAGTYTHAFRLGYGGSNNWLFRTVPTDATNAGGSTLASASGSAIPGQWTFLAGVFDITNTTMYLYVNGTLASSAVVGTPFASAGALSIGREWNNSAYDAYLNGRIDEARAYQRALTAAQVSTLATATLRVTPSRKPATRAQHPEGSAAFSGQRAFARMSASRRDASLRRRPCG